MAIQLTRKVVVPAWFLVFGLVALSGSGMLSARVLLLIVGGLMALAIIRPIGWRTCHATEPARRLDKDSLGSANKHDLMRMDSDKG